MMNLIQVHAVGTWFNLNQSFCSHVHLCPLQLQNRSSRENSLFRDNQPAASAPNVVSQSAEDVGVQRVATPTTLSRTASIGREVRKRSNIFFNPCLSMIGLAPGCSQVVWCHWGNIESFSAMLAQAQGWQNVISQGKIPRNFWLGQEWNGSI